MKTLYRCVAVLVLGVCALAGCATPDVGDYAAERPVLDLQRYFNGRVDAWGLFTDRSGKVVKRFTVVMDCRWQGDEGVLDQVLVNKTAMSKFGIALGDVTLFFMRKP